MSGAEILPRRTYLAALGGVLAAAAALQLGLYGVGFHRIAYDESARSLMALGLSWSNAFEPFIWPPFYKVFVGLALKLWGDVFVVPRLLVGLAGLLAILALVRLSDLVFGDRQVNLLTALLAVAFPHRLVFSVAPMSDIYGYLFLLLAAGCVLAWLRRGAVLQLLLGCACVLGAETVRFEAAFFALALSLLILHRWLLRRELGFGVVAAAAALLFAFPAFWIADTYHWYGSLESLGLTSRQYVAVFGADRLLALRLSPAGRNLALDLLWNPLMLAGLAALTWAATRDAAARAWAATFGAPFLLITAMMVLSLSIPMAAPWRTTGTWALLLLPFEAMAILWLADRLGRGRRPALRGLAFAALLSVALLPPAVRSAAYVREGMTDTRTGQPHEERAAGLHAVRELARSGGGKALLDSAGNLDFLDVLAGSGEPGRFVLSHGTDPQVVANGSALGFPPEDRFGLAGGGSDEMLAAEDVRLLLVREPRFVAAIEAAGRWERERSFGPWALFRPGAASAARSPPVADLSGRR